MKRPAVEEPRAGEREVQVPKCPDLKRPVLHDIIAEAVAAQPATRAGWLYMFGDECCENYGWNCCKCEYVEATPGFSPYCLSHGVEQLDSHVLQFIGSYVPEKCDPSPKELKQAAAAMHGLVKMCVSRGYCGPQPELLKELAGKGQVETDKIRKAIQRLADKRYWDAFETEQPGEPVVPPASSCPWSGVDVPRRETIGGEMPLQIREVRKDGWVLEDTEYDCKGYPPLAPSKEPFMRLPPEVAKLGRKGTQFSLMHLQLRKGIWRPVGSYEEEMVVGNVYGP
jgi:hypothetical protein